MISSHFIQIQPATLKNTTPPMGSATVVVGVFFSCPNHETFAQSAYSIGVDMWAVGCVFAEMATGGSESEVVQKDVARRWGL